MDYFTEYLPDELILIIIEYIDRDRKFPSINSLTQKLNGLLSISDRYNILYDKYMNLIDNGYINAIIDRYLAP